MATVTAIKVKIQYEQVGSRLIATKYVWLAGSGSNQIEFADGTTATPSPIGSYAHTHGGAAYQAANHAWHERFGS